MSDLRPYRLEPSLREKIWGRPDLAPWHVPVNRDIGEIWFLHQPDLPILVKLLFTSAKLSVQVHPDDSDGEPGKTEMWYVLRAEPGASIAMGFREPITREQLKAASLTGEIEGLLRWFPVHAGEAYLAPAGTVHALGPGLVLCEIQQNCDTTYRLYDYGRDRPLHVERACAIAHLGPHPGASAPVALSENEELLVDCEHFTTRSVRVRGATAWRGHAGRFHLLICTEGAGCFGDQPFTAGEVWMVPPDAPEFLIEARQAHFLSVWVPPKPGNS